MNNRIMLLSFIFFVFLSFVHAKELRVGVYENPPKIYTDSQGKAYGIYIDLLDDFAKKENEKLLLVPCLWSECLQILERSEIDIMPDMAHTSQREEQYLFAKEIVLSSWSVVYRNKKSNISSILDLHKKNIIVLQNSIQASAMQEYTKKFNIEPNFIEAQSFDEAFKISKKEHIDAILTNRFYTNKLIQDKSFIKTDILIEPSILTFAYPKKSIELQTRIDKYLKALKEDPNSIYYTSREALLALGEQNTLPAWVYYASFVLIGVLVILVFVVVLFRKMFQAKKDELEKSIITDALTGFSSRYKLMLDIQKAPKSSLALFNIDNFREINDFFGYQFGDATIIEVAKRVYETMSPLDNNELYHLQGDEFAILCRNTSQESFLDIVQKILKEVNSRDFHILHEVISLQFSAGVSFVKDQAGLLATADIALKNAKKERKELILYKDTSTTSKEYKSNLEWTKKLKDAIKDGRIVVYYQPIVSNATQEYQKYEALVRMIDTSGEIIAPSHFLSIAKRTKNYMSITQIVVSKSFDVFAKLPYEFAINLTIIDILDPEFNLFLFEKLDAYEGTSRVTFEIVESEGIENYKEVKEFILKVKSYGCKIAIDDFGTGYSNFEYLINLQVDIIKIDGSLIKQINKNSNANAVIKAIVTFAKSMDMQTIAEFVEDENIFLACKELGIEYSQGYYFSKALIKPFTPFS
ncbi:EAL domain-containing protein [bacterium]|nr:EAL domain-containing protein [bacterium]MBU1435522.1 EAL domain-containing protein [bacterium]MBU1502554.1 EAL domain-containing protein [bacterium]